MDRDALKIILRQLTAGRGIEPVLDAGAHVEAVTRTRDGVCWTFILNHGDTEADVSLPSAGMTDILTGRQLGSRVTIPSRDVVIARGA